MSGKQWHRALLTVLILLLFCFAPYITVFPLKVDSTLDELESVNSGVFSSGELSYVSDGKDLGSESYQLIKQDSGKIKLLTEGVVTPPIPIPFIQPKIKFDQEITVSSDLNPVQLKLDYDGPLGIGSAEIRAEVIEGTVKAKLSDEKKEAQLGDNRGYFQGTAGTGSLTALILAIEDGLGELTEIRTGGTGPQSGDEDELLVDLRQVKVERKNLDVDGSVLEVRRHVLTDQNSGIQKVFLQKDGTFIAFRRLGGENPFYVYRTDILGEDYEF